MQVMQLYASYASYASYAKPKCAKYRQRMRKSPGQRLQQELVERGSSDEATETFSITTGLIWPTGCEAEPVFSGITRPSP
jgi:hypothetical protein